MVPGQLHGKGMDWTSGIVKDHGMDCPTFHCIIHQEARCAKLLQVSDVMISVVNIVNIMKGGIGPRDIENSSSY